MTFEETTYADDCYFFWYMKKSELDDFRKSLTFKKGPDKMCWVTNGIDDVLDIMEQTVMIEGKSYIDNDGVQKVYPEFIAEDYVIIRFYVKYPNRIWYIKKRYDPKLPQFINDITEEYDALFKGTKRDLKIRDCFEVLSLYQAYNMECEI